jgi:hypothetical protein
MTEEPESWNNTGESNNHARFVLQYIGVTEDQIVSLEKNTGDSYIAIMKKIPQHIDIKIDIAIPKGV